MAEAITERLGAVSISDDCDTSISVSCWNIMGPARAADRKEVTTATFSHRFGGSSLGQADIICVQEMNFNPSGRVASKYLPFTTHYVSQVSKESEGGCYNAVFYKKEKFSVENLSEINRAFNLMEIKRNGYDEISSGGDEVKRDAMKGALCCSKDASEMCVEMCKEVLDECKAAYASKSFHYRIATQYKVPGEAKTKSPKTLLTRRSAICQLQVKSLPRLHIVVISVHNYYKIRGAPEIFINLLSDFISKLRVPVIIAGDFNYRLNTLPPQIINKFIFEDYKMKSLRRARGLQRRARGLQRIDYIAINNVQHENENFRWSIKDTEAHDLQKPTTTTVECEESEITNHNPLSATVCIEKKKIDSSKN